MIDAPVDINRLSKPEADAFRYIASALGATFAGDISETAAADTSANPDPSPPVSIKRGSVCPTSHADPALARALDAVPLPLFVGDGEAVMFVNRCGLARFAYSSAAVLDAAGGFGALFAGENRAGDAISLMTATGETFYGRATVAPISWAGTRAVLLAVQPEPEVGSSRKSDGTVLDPAVLWPLLELCPEAMAILAPEGSTEVANRPFRLLFGTPSRVQSGLANAPWMNALRHRALGGSGCASDVVEVHGRTYEATAAALGPGGHLAIVLRDRMAVQFTQQPPEPSNDAAASQRRGARDIMTIVSKARARAPGTPIVLANERTSSDNGLEASVAMALDAFLTCAAGVLQKSGVLRVRAVGADVLVSGGPETAFAFNAAWKDAELKGLAPFLSKRSSTTVAVEDRRLQETRFRRSE